MLDGAIRRRMPATHFITAPTFHRKRIFQNELFGELLTEDLMRWRQANELLLHDYVIMPDHLHLLVTAHSHREMAAALERLQAGFADELHRQYGYGGEVWGAMPRDREVHNAEQYEECARIIHSNPVRVGFCEKPAEYRMSSKSSRWILDPLPEALRTKTVVAGAKQQVLTSG